MKALQDKILEVMYKKKEYGHALMCLTLCGQGDENKDELGMEFSVSYVHIQIKNNKQKQAN